VPFSSATRPVRFARSRAALAVEKDPIPQGSPTIRLARAESRNGPNLTINASCGSSAVSELRSSGTPSYLASPLAGYSPPDPIPPYDSAGVGASHHERHALHPAHPAALGGGAHSGSAHTGSGMVSATGTQPSGLPAHTSGGASLQASLHGRDSLNGRDCGHATTLAGAHAPPSGLLTAHGLALSAGLHASGFITPALPASGGPALTGGSSGSMAASGMAGSGSTGSPRLGAFVGARESAPLAEGTLLKQGSARAIARSAAPLARAPSPKPAALTSFHSAGKRRTHWMHGIDLQLDDGLPVPGAALSTSALYLESRPPGRQKPPTEALFLSLASTLSRGGAAGACGAGPPRSPNSRYSLEIEVVSTRGWERESGPSEPSGAEQRHYAPSSHAAAASAPANSNGHGCSRAGAYSESDGAAMLAFKPPFDLRHVQRPQSRGKDPGQVRNRTWHGLQLTLRPPPRMPRSSDAAASRLCDRLLTRVLPPSLGFPASYLLCACVAALLRLRCA
jgi:hypothetical protein